MFKSCMFCALVAGATGSAVAGDRPVAGIAAGVKAVLVHDGAASYGAHRNASPQLIRRTSVSFTLPADKRTPDVGSTPLARLAPVEARTRPDWRVVTGVEEATARSGGTYAVRDTLDDHRKPRFRRSPLGTMLVLRMSGEQQAPAVTVGGGGVAAALWQVVPR